jgi:hypothetical protein
MALVQTYIRPLVGKDVEIYQFKIYNSDVFITKIGNPRVESKSRLNPVLYFVFREIESVP